MNDYPTFSVIIPTYNRAAILERTIRHLDTQDYPADRYEVLVVDDSSDETPSMVERLGKEVRFRLKLIHGERLPAVKRNQGVAEAEGEYILFFNDDVWSEPNLLREHAAAHARFGRPVAVLGLVDESPEVPYNPFHEAFRAFAYSDIADKTDQEVPFLYFWSMNLSVPRKVLLERNLLFHEDWKEIGGEDIELGYRWTQAGYAIVYNSRALGWHYHPYNLDSACTFAERIGRIVREQEWLIQEPYYIDHFGIVTWQSHPRKLIRGGLRLAVFNPVTVPLVRRWLRRQTRSTALMRWLYLKVLVFYVNRGYHGAWRRTPERRVAWPVAVTALVGGKS